MSNPPQTDPVAQTQTSQAERQVNIARTFWILSYETLYRVYFQEAVSSALVERWRLIDVSTNILIAVTASGSAIAGWAVWTSGRGRWFWLLLVGTASLASIVHGAVQVPTQLKEQEEFRRLFARLRIDIETFRQRLELGTGDRELLDRTYTELRERYADLVMRGPSSILNTRRLQVRAQGEVQNVYHEAGELEGVST